MFTVFDLIEVVTTVSGLVAGATTGYSWLGIGGGVGGAIVGGAVGLFVGRIPFALGLLWSEWDLRRKSTDELRRFLRRGICSWHLHVFALLAMPGEDVSGEFDAVLPMLVADDEQVRDQGACILKAFFPYQAAKVPDYEPEDPPGVCRAGLRQAGLYEPHDWPSRRLSRCAPSLPAGRACNARTTTAPRSDTPGPRSAR